MQIKNILVSSYGDVGISLVQRLFSLNFKPDQLFITILADKHDQRFLEFSKTYNIKHRVIHNIQDVADIVNATKFDMGICVGGLPFLIPVEILTQLLYGIVNLHSSDPNKYRGRWMSPWAIINNDKEYSYTWHYMNHEFDMGNILLQESFPINEDDTAFSLNHNIIVNALFRLPLVLDLVGEPGIKVTTKGHYYTQSIPHGGMIDSKWSVEYTKRFIRAMYHPPHRSAGVLDHSGKIVEIDNYIDYQEFQKNSKTLC
jgi:methionyl-tRNA formyltransferase